MAQSLSSEYGNLIPTLTAIVERHLARLKENPPSEQEWNTFFNDGLPYGRCPLCLQDKQGPYHPACKGPAFPKDLDAQ